MFWVQLRLQGSTPGRVVEGFVPRGIWSNGACGGNLLWLSSSQEKQLLETISTHLCSHFLSRFSLPSSRFSLLDTTLTITRYLFLSLSLSLSLASVFSTSSSHRILAPTRLMLSLRPQVPKMVLVGSFSVRVWAARMTVTAISAEYFTSARQMCLVPHQCTS